MYVQLCSDNDRICVFRLVYDRETGKPKGYGFCEYQDQETALSAMRNLNGREFSGRALRVDNAASEKNKEELKSKHLFPLWDCLKPRCWIWFDLIWHFSAVSLRTGLGTGAPIIESPYGDTIQPQEAPESISRAVASLPPEQMFELMKQMKVGRYWQYEQFWIGNYTFCSCPLTPMKSTRSVTLFDLSKTWSCYTLLFRAHNCCLKISQRSVTSWIIFSVLQIYDKMHLYFFSHGV